LRVSGRVTFLVANSKGYFRSNNRETIEEYITSLYERASSIREVAESVQEQLSELSVARQQTLF
jgi:hypothetical protein